jgi:hypothetical protein
MFQPALFGGRERDHLSFCNARSFTAITADGAIVTGAAPGVGRGRSCGGARPMHPDWLRGLRDCARRRGQALRQADRQQSRAVAGCHRQGRKSGAMAGRSARARFPSMNSTPGRGTRRGQPRDPFLLRSLTAAIVSLPKQMESGAQFVILHRSKHARPGVREDERAANKSFLQNTALCPIDALPAL